jgi:hypothetical protein
MYFCKIKKELINNIGTLGMHLSATVSIKPLLNTRTIIHGIQCHFFYINHIKNIKLARLLI